MKPDDPATLREALDRLRDAIAAERRDWHEVMVRPDDIAAVLAALDRSDPAVGLRAALAKVQRYSLTVEPDDSAYMELDPDGRYVLDEDVWTVVDHYAATPTASPTDPAAGLREAIAAFIDDHDAGRLGTGPIWCDGLCGSLADVRAALAATPTASPDKGSEPAGLREAWREMESMLYAAKHGEHTITDLHFRFHELSAALWPDLAATPTASPTQDES